MDNNLWRSVFIKDNHYPSLSQLAKPERWEYKNDLSPYNLPILRNYIAHTYRRLFELNNENPTENYMVIRNDCVCFNTGLFTNNYEPIYAYSGPNEPQYDIPWILKGFFPKSHYMLQDISELPKRAKYFRDISEVFYNTQYDLRIRVDHILSDEENLLRIPEKHREHSMLPMLLGSMAIEYAKIRIEENYKTAVPQYFNGRIQFLIPISLNDPAVVDLALAVSREGSTYTGRTCLTLDMAYNNARLIARPESEWL